MKQLATIYHGVLCFVRTSYNIMADSLRQKTNSSIHSLHQYSGNTFNKHSHYQHSPYTFNKHLSISITTLPSIYWDLNGIILTILCLSELNSCYWHNIPHCSHLDMQQLPIRFRLSN